MSKNVLRVVSVNGVVNGDDIVKSNVVTKVDNKDEDFVDAPDIESLVENSLIEPKADEDTKIEELAKAPLVEEIVEDSVEEKEPVGLRQVEEFGDDKGALEAYGRELGIELSKRKSISNMYKDLIEFVNA